MLGNKLREFICSYVPAGEPVTEDRAIRIEQIAFYSDTSKNTQELKKTICRTLGTEGAWSVDDVDCEGVLISPSNPNSVQRVFSLASEDYLVQHIRPALRLHYSYEVGTFEYEILESVEGVCCQSRLEPFAVSHFGVHVASVGSEVLYFLDRQGILPLTLIKTLKHTNPAVGTNHYWYAILATKNLLGFDLKLIERRT